MNAGYGSYGQYHIQATTRHGCPNPWPKLPPPAQPLLHHVTMHPSTTFASLLAVTSITSVISTVAALGLNCRGSGLCPLARFENKDPESIVQILRDAIYATSKPLTTTYTEGQHVVCISSSESVTIGSDISKGIDASGASESTGGNYKLDVAIGTGGICAFPNYLKAGASLTLAQIQPLADQVLEHKCKTCGSATVDWGNSPKDGYLTFNYVEDPFCDGDCISGDGTAVANSK
ncbi:hypothetical protein HO173_003598 [Letharia columbiana]|uniref:Killer toxin Kp4 domain-containing protein n=1 Tax=Letharia columbiana TaxID=112416 RepID=A0A8H6G0N0_9LECA|nr:uncharacterized protein HO173_003598 [Letharia columbiana]KAF6238318.1 hypothetical protein HO173_003598 [Letharia columbiana]